MQQLGGLMIEMRMIYCASQVVVGGCEEVSLTCAGSGMVVVHSATFLPLEGDCEQVRGDADSGQ